MCSRLKRGFDRKAQVSLYNANNFHHALCAAALSVTHGLLSGTFRSTAPPCSGSAQFEKRRYKNKRHGAVIGDNLCYLRSMRCCYYLLLVLGALFVLVSSEEEVANSGQDDAVFRPARRAIRGQDFAICLLVKDQNRDLREWVHYHRSMG
jgi:hypothetical protein